MKKQSRFSTSLIVLASLILGLVFVFPVWKITLGAPQYPNELVMEIWINKIVGGEENTLQNINILNHYIGMAPIVPDSFSELSYMPWIVIGLIFTGLLAALLRKRMYLAIWLVLIIGVGTVGLYDFYHWEHVFGSNLNPHAPIKLEGMTYSPPFIGKKVLLNIKATSFPAGGALVLFTSIFLTLLALVTDFIPGKKKVTSRVEFKSPKKRVVAFGVLGIVFILASSLTACNSEAKPINYGHDGCHYCKMTITDQRYGSELVTTKGKVFKFDSIECLIRFLKENEEGGTYYVTPYDKPGSFMIADEAFYLNSEKMPSPMGAFVTAFSSKEIAKSYQEKNGGELMNFDKVKSIIK